MSRPSRVDRTTVADKHLALRLTEPEERRLTELVCATNSQLRRQGLPVELTRTGLVRLLIRQASRQGGISPELLADEHATGALSLIGISRKPD